MGGGEGGAREEGAEAGEGWHCLWEGVGRGFEGDAVVSLSHSMYVKLYDGMVEDQSVDGRAELRVACAGAGFEAQ